MAWTQAEIDTLKAAIASGVLAVHYVDRTVTYRSLSEMHAALSSIPARLPVPHEARQWFYAFSTKPRTWLRRPCPKMWRARPGEVIGIFCLRRELQRRGPRICAWCKAVPAAPRSPHCEPCRFDRADQRDATACWPAGADMGFDYHLLRDVAIRDWAARLLDKRIAAAGKARDYWEFKRARLRKLKATLLEGPPAVLEQLVRSER